MTSYKTIEDKYRLFIKEYISNGFNGSQAYAKIYNIKASKGTDASASRLLTNVRVIKIYCEELAKLDLDINQQYILSKILQLLETTSKDSVKKGLLELLAKIKNMIKPDTQQTTVVFQDQMKERVANRLSQLQDTQ
ncbi:hypothetical protein AYK26_07480 [Euryarchaeota archaeon SM23-78]|nr:MAG: hypothetical protein AYK26_07480 [Euryarchaeota archaeon SM23-78]